VSVPPGARIVERLGGGDINEACRVVLADGREAFVKTRADAGEEEFAAEAAGLRWLADAGAVRVPEVIELGADRLVLEWIARGRLDDAGAEELGHGLAMMHGRGAPGFGDPGGSPRWGFGWVRVANGAGEDWASFYAQSRLGALARLGQDAARLPRSTVVALERVCARMADLVGPAEPAARLHGDLWSGNVLTGLDGRAWLIDPAVYGGHREVDLAMLRLFGSPSERIFAAYEESAPLSDGWRERVELYQLLPLLVHALLFGGSYVASVERVARRYGG
jgi:fructosamine-3-kinase